MGLLNGWLVVLTWSKCPWMLGDLCRAGAERARDPGGETSELTVRCNENGSSVDGLMSDDIYISLITCFKNSRNMLLLLFIYYLFFYIIIIYCYYYYYYLLLLFFYDMTCLMMVAG